MANTELKAQIEKLKTEEAKTGNSGAIPRTPKQMMMDVSDLTAKDPNHHYRWVSTAEGKMQSRVVEGYERVSESDGGRSLGANLVLMRIPRDRAEARSHRQRATTDRRLDSHNTEMMRLAEGVSKELRDRHGIKVPAERLLVKE